MNEPLRWDYQAGAWVMLCEVCKNEFHSKRRDAATCSPRCRKWKNRADERKQTALHTLQHASYSARRIAKEYAESQDVYDQMVILKKAVDAGLKMFNVTWEQQQLPDVSPALPKPAAKASRVTKQQKKRYGEVAPLLPADPVAPDSASA